MKILHVITSLRMGGAEKLMVDLLPRMKAMGLDVTLAVFDSSETLFYNQIKSAGIKIIGLSPGKNVYSLKNLYKLIKLMRGYDVIHTHITACQLFAAICSVLCSVVLVTTEHNTSNRRRDWKWYAWIDKWMYSRYRHVICISKATENNLRDFIHDQSDKISTIHNGIDVCKYQSAQPVEKSTIVNDSNHKIITMVAAFRYQKDQETLIRATTLLSEDYEVCLVGDGERRKEIEEYIVEKGVSNRVHLLGLRDDVPSILKASDIVVLSSHWEGFGLAIVEGMAAGKPVIASDVEGLAQVVSGAGLLFPHQDEKCLVKLIENLSNNKTFYQEVSQACTKRAMDFDIQNMAQKYVEVYEHVIRL